MTHWQVFTSLLATEEGLSYCLPPSTAKKPRWSTSELSSPEVSVGSRCTPASSCSMAPGCWGLYSSSRNPLHLHKQQISDSRATGEVSQFQARHRAVCTESPDSFLHCRLFCFYWCNLSKPSYAGPIKLMASLTPHPKPGSLQLWVQKGWGEGGEITKSKCNKAQLVSTIRLECNAKCLLRISEKRKRGADPWQCEKVYNLTVKGEKSVETEERSQAQHQGWLSKCLKLITIGKGSQELWGRKKLIRPNHVAKEWREIPWKHPTSSRIR